MQIPPDARRATTAQPAVGSRAQPTGAPRSHPLMTAPPSQPLPGSRSQPLPGSRSQPLPAPRSQPQRLQLSGLIDDRIRAETARKQRRAWLVNTVVLAQALITLMVVPGYLIPAPNLPMALTLGVALLFYLAAFLFNRMRRDLDVAYYMLIGGGALATAAQVFVTASLSYNSAHTAQAALLFLPIILEAGLFLSPELTLLVASAAAIVTASAILLALALGSDAASLNDAYLVMVYALGLEAFIGFLAWRLAQFMYETLKSAQADQDLRFTQARLSASESRMNEQRSLLTQDVGTIQMAVSNALAHEYDTRIEISDGELAPLALSLNLLIQQLRSTNDLERRMRNMEAQAVPLVEMAGRLATGAMPSLSSETPTDSAFYSVRAALSQAQTMNARRQARLQEVAAEISNSLRHSREGLANTADESAQAQAIAGQLVSLVEMLNQTALRQVDLLAQARRALALVLPPELTQSELADGSLRESPRRDAEATGDLAGLGADIGILNRDTNDFPIVEPLVHDESGIPPMTAPLPSLRALAPSDEANGSVADDTGHTGSSLAQGELPAGLVDTWLLLSLLQQQTNEEARAVANFVHDIGMLSKHVRVTGVDIDWVNQAMDAIERGAEQMQQLASPSGASIDLGDEMMGASGMARPGSVSLPRRSATHPLDADARLAAEQDALPSEQPSVPDAAPGSLRGSELFAPEAFGSTGAPSTPLVGVPPSAPRDETDPQQR